MQLKPRQEATNHPEKSRIELRNRHRQLQRPQIPEPLTVVELGSAFILYIFMGTTSASSQLFPSYLGVFSKE